MSSPLARAHSTNRGHRRLRHQALALAAAGALVLAACGGDDDSEGGDTTEASAETTAAEATDTTVAAGTSETTAAAGSTAPGATGTDYSEPPTELTVDGELSAVPEKKEVAFIVCADPSCTTLAGFLEETMDVLGWDLTTVNASATDPGAAV